MPGYEAGLPADSINAAKEFKASGYRTGLIGKWHLGDQTASHPNAQGFDEFFGFLWGETGYYTHTKAVIYLLMVAGLIGIAWLSACSLLCLLAVIPIYARRKDWVFVLICICAVLVQLLAASGMLSSAH